jgi:hypothetical protein
LTHPDIKLLKFLIIAEMEAAPQFDVKTVNISNTWKNIHVSLMNKLEGFSELPADKIISELGIIAGIVLLEVQIEFSFTKRHQFSHGMHPNTCVCTSFNSDTPISPLMKFNDWVYKHINLEMFPDPEVVTQKLLSVVEKCNNFDAQTVFCFIEIFTSILMLGNNFQLVETVKQVLVAIIASPFYKCLKENLQFRNLAGFQKVMSYLPMKLQTFFDTRVEEYHLQGMKLDSIMFLSQLEISAICKPC